MQNAQLIMVPTKKMMQKKNTKTLDKKKTTYANKDSITSKFIIIIFTAIALFYESFIILIGSLQKGIIKKEILTKKNNLGFDIIIKRID